MPGAAVKITKFLGEAPKVSAELLPDSSAQLAYNTKLYSGDLIPYRKPATEASLNTLGTVRTIFPMTNGNVFRWLSWIYDVNIAVGQVENDTSQRIYYSGDTLDEDTAKVTNFTLASTYGLKVSVSVARTSNVATIITEKHYLRTGEFVTTTLFTDSTFDAVNVPVTVVNGTTFTFDNTGADVGTTADTAGRVNRVTEVYPQSFYTLGLPAPTVACTAATTSFAQLSAAATNSRSRDSGNTATINLSTNHNLFTGAFVTITGFADTTFNQVNVQITVTDADSFTFFSYGPAVALGDDAGGRVDIAGTTYPRTYVYTWVTTWGEESPPSPPSAIAFAKEGQIVELTVIATDMAVLYSGRYQTSGMTKRIYRSVATAAGTEYYRLGEIALATAAFTDDYDISELVDTLESEEYDTPPVGLRGLMAIHNGMMAGFFGNTVCFSMPNQPHAWPIVHYERVDSDIVAIGLIGKTIVVATKGRPWLIQGNFPENMTAQKDDSVLPCSSKQSLVNLPYGVVWSSPGGLAVYAPASGGNRLTEAVHSWDTWDDYIDDTTVVAAFYQGKYFGSSLTGSFIFEREQRTGGVLVRSDTVFTAGYYHIATDAFYYATVFDGVNTVFRWDSPLQPLDVMDWKSKVFITKEYANLGAARLVADFLNPLDAAEIATYNAYILAYNTDMISAGVATVTRERTTNVSTIVCTSDHNLLTGDIVTTAAFSDATFNASSVVITVTNSTTFTYPNVGANVVSTADTGGSVTLNTMMVPPRFIAGMGSIGSLMLNEYPVDGSALKEFLATTSSMGFTLYADKRLVFTRGVSDDEAFRMPTGYRADTFEVEVTGPVRVRAIHLAETISGLKRI